MFGARDSALVATAEAVYNELSARGVDVLLDDRDERPGVKFKDSDLIGFPVRVVLGSKSLAEGKVEISLRRDGERRLVAADAAADAIVDLLKVESPALD